MGAEEGRGRKGSRSRNVPAWGAALFLQGSAPCVHWEGAPLQPARSARRSAQRTGPDRSAHRDQRLGEAGRHAPSLPTASAWLPSLLHSVSHLSLCPRLLTLHGGPHVRPASRPRHTESISQDPSFLALQTKKYADVIIPRGVDNMGKEQACAGTAQPI